MKYEKKIATSLATVLALVWIISSALFVNAASTSNMFVISPGVYPGSGTYTFYADGSTFYAKNQYGINQFKSTNASEVFNAALDIGSVFVSPGTYTLTAPIVIDQSSRKLYGENERETIITQATPNADVVKIGVSTGYIENIEVNGLSLIGSGGATTGRGLNIQGAVLYSNYHDLLISNCYDGVMMNATYSNRSYRSYVTNIHISGCSNIGFAMYQQDGHTLNHINIQNCAYGVRIDYLTQGIIATAIRTDAITYTAIQICGQGIKLYSPFVSESGGYGIQIHGGSHDIEIFNPWIEASDFDQVYIANDAGYEFDIFDVKIRGGNIVRGESTGIKMVGQNGKTISNILIDGVNIANNAQSGSGQGIYGFNNTYRVRINECNIGNWALDSGAPNQGGIGSDNTCNNWTITGNDLSTVATTIAPIYRIVLAGTTNKVENNDGYKTFSSGTATIANNEDVPHGLVGTPTSVIVTARFSNLGSGQPVNIGVISTAATTFRMSALWADNKSYVTSDIVTLYWEARYQPYGT